MWGQFLFFSGVVVALAVSDFAFDTGSFSLTALTVKHTRLPQKKPTAQELSRSRNRDAATVSLTAELLQWLDDYQQDEQDKDERLEQTVPELQDIVLAHPSVKTHAQLLGVRGLEVQPMVLLTVVETFVDVPVFAESPFGYRLATYALMLDDFLATSSASLLSSTSQVDTDWVLISGAVGEGVVPLEGTVIVSETTPDLLWTVSISEQMKGGRAGSLVSIAYSSGLSAEEDAEEELFEFDLSSWVNTEDADRLPWALGEVLDLTLGYSGADGNTDSLDVILALDHDKCVFQHIEVTLQHVDNETVLDVNLRECIPVVRDRNHFNRHTTDVQTFGDVEHPQSLFLLVVESHGDVDSLLATHSAAVYELDANKLWSYSRSVVSDSHRNSLSQQNLDIRSPVLATAPVYQLQALPLPLMVVIVHGPYVITVHSSTVTNTLEIVGLPASCELEHVAINARQDQLVVVDNQRVILILETQQSTENDEIFWHVTNEFLIPDKFDGLNIRHVLLADNGKQDRQETVIVLVFDRGVVATLLVNDEDGTADEMLDAGFDYLF